MTTLAHAFDIETSGPQIGPGRLMSIGACCLEIPKHGPVEVINSFFVTIAWDGGLVFDHAATRDFWDKNPDALRHSTTACVSPSNAACALRAHICNVQQTALRRRAKYTVITDNAYFDVPWIDWFLCTFAKDGLPLRYNYHTGWMPHAAMVDLSQRIQTLHDLGIQINMETFQATVPHDHHPLHDATGLAEKYAFYKRMVHGFRSRMRVH